MATLTFGQPKRPTIGRPKRKRVELTDDFLVRLLAERVTGETLGTVGAFPHYPFLSALLHQRVIPAAPDTIDRFYRLADALDYPRDRVFREA